MPEDRFLADTSAMSRMHRPAVAAVLGPLVDRGLVGTCGVLDLEALYAARTGAEHEQIRVLRANLPRYPMPDEVWDRAVEVQGLLADPASWADSGSAPLLASCDAHGPVAGRSRHRAVSLADLLVAATAERHRLTVLHYDADYETVAAVTGQPVRWVVPRGGADGPVRSA